MKELNELNFPDDVRYAESHEWARSEGDGIKVGISDYAHSGSAGRHCFCRIA
jgi:glycine cleavage system H protein